MTVDRSAGEPDRPSPIPQAAAETKRFAIPPDHPSLPGHFPGRPVVPGVVLLDAVFALAGVAPSRLLRAKFAAPVAPGEEVEVSLEVRGGGRLAFYCRCGGALVLSGEAQCPVA